MGVQFYKVRSSRLAATGDFVDSPWSIVPLEVVLFPGLPLPLHIFEPRYKEMIGNCLAQSRAFGVVRSVEQGVAEVGCTAEIVTVVKRYSDGRLDIVTQGRERCRILNINQERSFFRAQVLMFEDEPGTPTGEDAARAVALHSEILGLAGPSQDLSGNDPSTLSFYLAASLP